jgi:galactonate dehydratase
MKITKIETFLAYAGRCNMLFIKVCTDEGIDGIGEATVEGKEATVEAVIKEYSRYLIGKNPMEIEKIWQSLYLGNFWKGGVIQMSGISGIDQALWDIKGKALGVPVYELLGGPIRNKIRCYTHLKDTSNPEELAKDAQFLVQKGWNAVKFLSAGPSQNEAIFKESDIMQAVEKIKILREKIGDGIDIMLDNHGRFSPYEAIKIGKLIEPYNPYFFEEPTPPEDLGSLLKVSRSLRIPIATGERLYSKWDFKNVLYKYAADIIQPDLCHAGGITEVKKIASLAEACNVKVAPHNPLGPVSTAACIQLDAAIPNFLIQEVSQYDRWGASWVKYFVKQPLEVENSYIKLPTKPGLGVELNEDVIKQYPYNGKDLPKIYKEDGTPTAW